MPIPAAPPPPSAEAIPAVTTGAVLATPTLALGTLDLNRADSTGTEWICQNLEGWDGFTAVGPLQELPGDHGASAGEAFLAARVLTLEGRLFAPDLDTRDVALTRLIDAIPLNFDGTVLRVDETVPKQTEVRVSGAPQITRLGLIVSFSIGLVARDPRKYSVAVHHASVALPTFVDAFAAPLTPPVLLPARPTENRSRVVNDGNFPTAARLRIMGPVRSPRVRREDTGQVVWWDLDVNAGQFLEVDMGLRQAWLDGTAYRPAGFGSSWWTVPPGGCFVQFTGAEVPGVPGAGTLTIETRSAWR